MLRLLLWYSVAATPTAVAIHLLSMYCVASYCVYFLRHWLYISSLYAFTHSLALSLYLSLFILLYADILSDLFIFFGLFYLFISFIALNSIHNYIDVDIYFYAWIAGITSIPVNSWAIRTPNWYDVMKWKREEKSRLHTIYILKFEYFTHWTIQWHT